MPRPRLSSTPSRQLVCRTRTSCRAVERQRHGPDDRWVLHQHHQEPQPELPRQGGGRLPALVRVRHPVRLPRSAHPRGEVRRQGRPGPERQALRPGERPQRQAGYRPAHEVPFYLSWPAGGLSAGTTDSRITANIDVAPTFREYYDLAGDPYQLTNKLYQAAPADEQHAHQTRRRHGLRRRRRPGRTDDRHRRHDPGVHRHPHPRHRPRRGERGKRSPGRRRPTAERRARRRGAGSPYGNSRGLFFAATSSTQPHSRTATASRSHPIPNRNHWLSSGR